MKGKRVHLRMPEPGDLELLYDWENRTDQWKNGSTLIPFSKEDLKNYIQSIRDIYRDQQLRLMICLNESNTCIGMCDLFDFDPIHQRAAVGIMIAEESYLNQGFASEALQLMNAYAREVLGLHQLHAGVRSSNTASLKLFAACGFQRIAEKKDWYRNGTSWDAEVIFQRFLSDL